MFYKVLVFFLLISSVTANELLNHLAFKRGKLTAELKVKLRNGESFIANSKDSIYLSKNNKNLLIVGDVKDKYGDFSYRYVIKTKAEADGSYKYRFTNTRNQDESGVIKIISDSEVNWVLDLGGIIQKQLIKFSDDTKFSMSWVSSDEHGVEIYSYTAKGFYTSVDSK